MLEDGETVEFKGSAKDPYVLKNTGGVYSCSCPAWRNQSVAIERRTCKHLRQVLGEEFEKARLGGELPEKTAKPRHKVSSGSNANGAAGVNGESADSSVPGILLAHSWEGDINLKGWWMSEKLDGVRAYWDGQQFISRQGNVYMAPEWFVEDLPKDIHLDGELWLGRKLFQRAVSIVRRQDKNNDWKDIKFVVFDAPLLDDLFEARMAFIQQLLDEIQGKYVEAHVHVRCDSEEHLREELARVEALGGEGLMLRKPGSKYEVGRSSTLLKVKTFHDAEAVVIEHLPGTGKHKGRLGALSVELADKTRFSVGTGFSDAERENPPAVGSIITFRYQELSDRGVPRFPSFVRIRTDLEGLTSSPLASHPTAVLKAESINVQTGASAVPANNAEATSSTATEFVGEAKSAAAKSTATKSTVAKSTVAKSTHGTTGSWREFEFSEDTSNKFWMITTNGSDVTVKFGKIGTAGQEKTKSFPSPAAARKYADEIIMEKVKKGYEETSSGSTAEENDEDSEEEDLEDGEDGDDSAQD